MKEFLTEKQKKVLNYTGFGLLAVGGILVLVSNISNIVNTTQLKYKQLREGIEKRRIEREKAAEERRIREAKLEAIRQAKLKRIREIWPIYLSNDYYTFTSLDDIKRFRRWSSYLEVAGIWDLGDLVYYIDKNGFSGLEKINGIGPIGKAEIVGFFLAYGKRSFVENNK